VKIILEAYIEERHLEELLNGDHRHGRVVLYLMGPDHPPRKHDKLVTIKIEDKK
jgi:hypothetical protein